MPFGRVRNQKNFTPTVDHFESSYGEVFGATMDSQSSKVFTGWFGRWRERFKAEVGFDVLDSVQFLVSPGLAYREAQRGIQDSADRAEYIGQPDIDQMYQEASGYSPDEFERNQFNIPEYKDLRTRRSVVELDVDNWNFERKATRIIQQRPEGPVGNAVVFAGAMLAELKDPVSMAANFIPVVGEARMLEWTRKYGSFAARSLTATAEGLVGSTLMEGLQAKSEKEIGFNTYSTSDAFFNIAVGTALSFGVHHVAGGVSDFSAGRNGSTRFTLSERADVDLAVRTQREALETRGLVDPARLDVPEVVREGSRSRIQGALDENPISLRRIDSPAHGIAELRRHASDWFERGHTPDASYQFDLLALDELRGRGRITDEDYKIKFQEIVSAQARKPVDLSKSWLEKDFEPKVRLDTEDTVPRTSAESVDEVLPQGARASDLIDEAQSELFDAVDAQSGITLRQRAIEADSQVDGVSTDEFNEAVKKGVDCVTGVEAEIQLPPRAKVKVAKGKTAPEQTPRQVPPEATDPVAPSRGLTRSPEDLANDDAFTEFMDRRGEITDPTEFNFTPAERLKAFQTKQVLRNRETAEAVREVEGKAAKLQVGRDEFDARELAERPPSAVPVDPTKAEKVSPKEVARRKKEGEDLRAQVEEGIDTSTFAEREAGRIGLETTPPEQVQENDLSFSTDVIMDMPQEGRDFLLARAVEGQEHLETETASILNEHRTESLRQKFGEDLPEFSEEGSEQFAGELSEAELQRNESKQDLALNTFLDDLDAATGERTAPEDIADLTRRQDPEKRGFGRRAYLDHIQPIYDRFFEKTDIKPLYDADPATLNQYRQDAQEAFTQMKRDINALGDKGVSFAYSLDNTPPHIAEDISFRLNVGDQLTSIHNKVRSTLRADIDSVNEVLSNRGENE